MNQHTYVICAYKESPFLEECIRSLKAQTVQSEIIMATSTPNDYIRSLADEYEIPLFVNSGPGGITQDWNFGYAQTNTPYVTIRMISIWSIIRSGCWLQCSVRAGR